MIVGLRPSSTLTRSTKNKVITIQLDLSVKDGVNSSIKELQPNTAQIKTNRRLEQAMPKKHRRKSTDNNDLKEVATDKKSLLFIDKK